jgi:hypothetical protein
MPSGNAQEDPDCFQSAPITDPGRSLEVSGSQTDLPTPWYKGRAEIIPFRLSPGEGEVGIWSVVFQENPVTKQAIEQEL